MRHPVVISSAIACLSLLAAACAPEGRVPVDDKPPPTQFPEVIRFDASDNMIGRGGTVTLNYEVRNADTVQITPMGGPERTQLTDSLTVGPLTETTSFTLTARSQVGETTRVVTVIVGGGDEVGIVSFTATPETIAPGGAVTLRWTVENAQQVTLADQTGNVVDPNLPLEGERIVNPTDSIGYVLTAIGPGGPATANVEVRVLKTPTINTFEATPEMITVGGTSSLAWEVTGADGITILDGAGANVTMSTESQGSVEVTPTTTTEYTLIATNAVGSVDDRRTVTVEGGGAVEINSFTVNPRSLPFPGDVELAWMTTGAATITLTGNGQPVAGFSGAASGTFTVAVAASTTFVLTASGPGGSVDRTLNVVVDQLADTTLPIITHTPIIATQPAGTDVAIEANASDADSGIASVVLHYRVIGAPAFSQLTLTDAGGGTYRVVIPGASVAAPSIEYFIEATDAAQTPNVARSPETSPDVYSFSVAMPDTEAPTIGHTPIADGQLAGSAVSVRATITDTGSGVNTAALFYRIEGAAQFTSVPLSPLGGDTYGAELPAGNVMPNAIEYYLAATDGASPANTGTLPDTAPASVMRFTVTPLDSAPPSITHTAIADNQTAGGSVAVIATITDPSGVSAAAVLYRTTGQANFTRLAMAESGGLHRATIPAGAVVSPGVDYYIEASDGATPVNRGTFPAAGGATPIAFTVVVVDTNPPSITHTPVPAAQPPGTAVTVAAQITDASNVASATLNYRAQGTTQFVSVPMTGGPAYTAQIPAAAIIPPGIEYYLLATDGASPANAGSAPVGAPPAVYSFLVGQPEAEPNNTAATATPLLTGGQTDNVGLGGITPSTDRDWWYVDVPAGGFFNLSLETTSGGVGLCPAPTDTVVRLYGGDGSTLLGSDSFDGVGSCSQIRPADDAFAVALATGRYYVRVEESGGNAVIGGYEIRAQLTTTACGNGVYEAPAGEQCDDGNTAPGDGCSATCTIEPDGVTGPPGRTFNGAISPAGDADVYALDIGAGQNLIARVDDGMGGCPGDSRLELFAPDGTTLLGSDDADGVGDCSLITALRDTWAANMAAGRYLLRLRADQAGGTIAAYVLTIEIRTGICGNGTVEMGEQCDDTNGNDFDGCSSTCQFETSGVAMGTGASFTDSISPVGNVDYFQVNLAAGDSITAETFAPVDGQCDAGNDTVIRLMAADRTTQIAVDDDDGVRTCSRMDPARDLAARNLAAGTYFVVVEEFNNNGTIAAYVLNIQIQGAACGNGWLDGADQCDDGNTTAGDGCSSTCQFEGPPEAEPNDTFATATPLITGTATVGVRFGALSSSNDLDVYSVVVPEGRHIFAAVTDGNGGCNNDGNIRLRGTDGTTSLAFDTADGPGSCGQITPGTDSGARGLGAGTYFLEVTGSGGPSAYVIEARILTPGCGDQFVDPGEQCDDGNTVAGDGCNATCQFEGAGEVEPNDTIATATPLITNAMMTPTVQARGVLSALSDKDLYSVVVPDGYHLIAEISDGAGGCPNGGDLRLRTNTGTSEVFDQEDGPESCGRIAADRDTNATGMSGGTYILEVDADATATAVYVLSVSVVAPNQCGNGLLETGEACDDGNMSGGDGCDASCAFDWVETEPNNDRASAQLLATRTQMISGAIGPSGDSDWYRLVIAEGQSMAVVTHTGAVDSCPSIDTVIELYRPSGQSLTGDDDDGARACSAVDRAQAANLAAGDYWVRVRPFSSFSTFGYAMTITIY